MKSDAPAPISGNVVGASKDTRGWFLGHFISGEENPLQTSDLEMKWYTHAKGDTRNEWAPGNPVRTSRAASRVGTPRTRNEWAPGNPVRTLNILIRGHFVLLFPDQEVSLEKEGDFVLFGPGVPHSFRSVEESLVLTVRWPSVPQ